MHHSSHFPRQWSEAQDRAETYLRVLRGCFGPDERQLLAAALGSARGQLRLNPNAHPLTLVMEALFGFLPAPAPAAMTPPIQRRPMLPERTEFPVHNWLRRCFGGAK